VLLLSLFPESSLSISGEIVEVSSFRLVKAEKSMGLISPNFGISMALRLFEPREPLEPRPLPPLPPLAVTLSGFEANGLGF
jgi:hypothetical protein